MALSLRMGVTHQFVGFDAPPDANANPDQLDYELFAHQMSRGLGYTNERNQVTALRAPGTSLMLTSVYWMFGHSYTVGRVWFCLLSALTCLVVGLIGWRCFGAAVGLTASACLAVYPGHFYYSMHFLSETPFCLWLALAVWLTIRAVQSPSMGAHVVAGICWGLSVLTRPHILLALPIVVMIPLLVSVARRPKHLMALATQVCVVVAVVSPWVIRNAVVMGKPTIATISGIGFWGSNNEMTLNDPEYRGRWVKHSVLSRELRHLPPDELGRDAMAWRYGIEFVQRHPGEMLQLCAMKLVRFISPFPKTDNKIVQWMFGLSWIAVAPLVVLGLGVSWRQRRQESWVLVLPILATMFSVVIFYGSVRFRDSCAPVFIPLAAYGLVCLVRKIRPQLTSQQRPSARACESVSRGQLSRAA